MRTSLENVTVSCFPWIKRIHQLLLGEVSIPLMDADVLMARRRHDRPERFTLGLPSGDGRVPEVVKPDVDPSAPAGRERAI